MTLQEQFQCAGKIAVVTGGAGLYGYAISEALCEAGATVIVASRSDAVFQEKCAGLKERYPIVHERLDLMEEESITQFVQRVTGQYGRIDILVNNAVTPFGGVLETTAAEQWERAMRGNGVAVLSLCQKVAQGMKERRSGVILNISSIWGQVAPDYQAYFDAEMPANPIAYSFLKGGINMLTKALCSYLSPYGIRVNAISPGGIADDTDAESYREVYRKKTPLGRWAQPDDIKGAVIYLCSDASSYVTGANLMIDGGYSAR